MRREVGDVQVAVRIHRDVAGPEQLDRDRDPAIAIAARDDGASPRYCRYLALQIQSPHPAVSKVRDVQIARLGDGNSVRMVQLCRDSGSAVSAKTRTAGPRYCLD